VETAQHGMGVRKMRDMIHRNWRGKIYGYKFKDKNIARVKGINILECVNKTLCLDA
jgi:hypothetical protein